MFRPARIHLLAVLLLLLGACPFVAAEELGFDDVIRSADSARSGSTPSPELLEGSGTGPGGATASARAVDGPAVGGAAASRKSEPARAPDYLPLKLDGKEIEVVRVHGEGIDYRLGRDNLAFPNPSGVMRLGGMAGNCYTMAFVSKLFHEDAEYFPLREGAPDAARRGVWMRDLSAHLSRGRNGKLPVHGYESLFDLTTDPDPASAVDLEDRIQDHLRRRAGLGGAGAAPAEEPSGRMFAVSQVSQFITAIHYFYFVQRSGQDFIRSVAAERLAGEEAPRRITREQTESIKALLREGRTALVNLWDNSVFFGHVVLAYAAVESEDADWLILYDNNVQYGTERRPSVLRVGKRDRSIRMFLRQEDGTLTGGRGERCEVVLHMPDLSLAPSHLADLERVVRDADAETAFLMAGNELLQSMTTRSPRDSSLLADARQFILNLQQVQKSLGLQGIRPEDRIGPDATLDDVNRILFRYSEIGVRTASPYGLPPGIEISDTRMVFWDEHDASVAATIRVAPGTTARSLTAALEQAGAFSGPEMAAWLGTVRDAVGQTPIRADLHLSLHKGRGADSIFRGLGAAKAPYGPVVGIRKAHVVLGDIEPTSRVEEPFALEVASAVASTAVNSLLARQGAIGRWHEVDADTDTRLDAIEVAFERDQVRVRADASVFRAITGENSGVTLRTRDMTARLFVTRRDSDPESAWRFRATLGANFSKDDGLAGFGNLFIGAALAVMKGKVQTAIRSAVLDAQSELNGLLTGPLKDHVRVIQPLDMRRGGQLTWNWGRSWLTAWTPANPGAIGSTGQLAIDLSPLGSKLPGELRSYRIGRIEMRPGRLLVTARPRREEPAD